MTTNRDRYRVLCGVHAELEAAGCNIDIGQLDWAVEQVGRRLFEASLEKQYEAERQGRTSCCGAKVRRGPDDGGADEGLCSDCGIDLCSSCASTWCREDGYGDDGQGIHTDALCPTCFYQKQQNQAERAKKEADESDREERRQYREWRNDSGV